MSEELSGVAQLTSPSSEVDLQEMKGKSIATLRQEAKDGDTAAAKELAQEMAEWEEMSDFINDFHKETATALELQDTISEILSNSEEAQKHYQRILTQNE